VATADEGAPPACCSVTLRNDVKVIRDRKGVATGESLKIGRYALSLAFSKQFCSCSSSSFVRGMALQAAQDTDVEALELASTDLHLHIKPLFPDFFQALKDLASVRAHWLDLTQALVVADIVTDGNG